MSYITTKKVNFKENFHGFEISDPYVWLENAKDKEVLDWVDSQNLYTDDYFGELKKNNVNELALKLKNSSKCTSYSGLYELNERIFAGKKDEKGETSSVILDMDFNEIEVIADGNMFDRKYTIFGAVPSILDNGICAINALKHGSPRLSSLIYDYKNKKLLKEIEGIFSFTWSNDGKKLYFADAEVDKIKGINKNYLKSYNYITDTTELIYKHEKHSPFLILSMSKDGKYLFLNCMADYADNELIVLKVGENNLQTLTGEKRGKFKYLGTSMGKHYVLTDHGAPNGKIVSMDECGGTYENSKLIVEEGKRIIVGAFVTDKYLIVKFMNDVVSEIEIYNHNGVYIQSMELPSKMGTIGLTGEFGNDKCTNSDNIYFEFESFIDPPCILCYNEKTEKLTIVYQTKDLVVPDDIVVTREFITARDGVKVPAFIVHKKDVVLNGENPTLMYGYGGYNISMPPRFTNMFIGLDIWDWVNKGYVYVNCNIRGGNEYGAKWHKGGNLENKKNVFYDFIDITEYLIANKWTNPKRIAITGGSNGGLLVTALITLRPDLWGAVIASVPHTDMIRFMYDDRGTMYTTEYGNPRDKNMFSYLLSYSPYHNIKETNYPAIYLQTGELDNNVPPYHAKKFAAKMQALNTSDKPVLLRVLAEGSHDVGNGDDMYKTYAEMQTFIANALELKM